MCGLFKNSPILKVITTWTCGVIMLASLFAFNQDELIHQLAEQAQRSLNSFHGLEPESAKIKRCEITISDEGFLRYRKFYVNGKQEYYSFNLTRLRSIDYFGSTNAGNLIIRTLDDDVIVQTYNDRAGNVDSMSVKLNMVMKSIEPEDLARIQQELFDLKKLIER